MNSWIQWRALTAKLSSEIWVILIFHKEFPVKIRYYCLKRFFIIFYACSMKLQRYKCSIFGRTLLTFSYFKLFSVLFNMKIDKHCFWKDIHKGSFVSLHFLPPQSEVPRKFNKFRRHTFPTFCGIRIISMLSFIMLEYFKIFGSLLLSFTQACSSPCKSFTSESYNITRNIKYSSVT